MSASISHSSDLIQKILNRVGSPIPSCLISGNISWLVLAMAELLIRQALFVNLARAEVSKPLDGLKLNGIGTLQ